VSSATTITSKKIITQSFTYCVLVPGKILSSNQCVKVGDYQLTMQQDGNLVFKNITNNSVVWESKTANQNFDYAQLLSNGTLRLHRTSPTDKKGPYFTVIEKTPGAISSRLYISSYGTFRIYTKSVIWKSDESKELTTNYFNLNSGTEISGSLEKNQTLMAIGDFKAKLFRNGNFVVKDYSKEKKSTIVWQTQTSGQSIKKLCFQNDGNLVLLPYAPNKVSWASNTDTNVWLPNGTKHSLRLYDNGLLAIATWKFKKL
jgi:hypothetical protein